MIYSARRRARRTERRCRVTGLTVDKEIMNQTLLNLHAIINEAKASFLESKILESTGKKSLFRVVDSFLLVKPGLCASLRWLSKSVASFFERSRIYERALMLLPMIGFLRSGNQSFHSHHSYLYLFKRFLLCY
jgi:hypothetical protein